MSPVNSDRSSRCPECGAPLPAGQTCDDLMKQVAEWEQEDPAGKSADHHLLVLCWQLQHPARFSDEALAWARVAVSRSLSAGLDARQLHREVVAGSPAAPIRITPGHPDTEVHPHSFVPPQPRPKTLADVVGEGREALPGSIRRWAESVALEVRQRGE